MEYFHWPAWASCLALLLSSSCTLAHQLNTGHWRKSLFHSNNWKHKYSQLSSHAKSKTQQLPRGKLTLSQLKPGQPGRGFCTRVGGE